LAEELKSDINLAETSESSDEGSSKLTRVLTAAKERLNSIRKNSIKAMTVDPELKPPRRNTLVGENPFEDDGRSWFQDLFWCCFPRKRMTKIVPIMNQIPEGS
jgi:hypothetical protein